MQRFILFMAIIALFTYAISPSKTADFYATDIHPNCEIVLFSTSWCGACKTTRAFLKRQAYSFCEFDIEKNSPEAKYYQRLGTNSVPALVIGNQIVIGGNFKRIQKLVTQVQ